MNNRNKAKIGALSIGVVAMILIATTVISLIVEVRSLPPAHASSSSEYVLTLRSSPYPSKVTQNVSLFGTYTNSSGTPLADARIVLKYSNGSELWTLIGVAYTNSEGRYSTNWKPPYTGIFSVLAFSDQTKTSYEHVVANYIVALDGSGDLTSIPTALAKLPLSGGTVFVKDGVYQNIGIKISGRSNVNLVGNGYNTKVTKMSGVLMWVENVTNLLIKSIHFHHLTNDHYGSMSIKGFNDGLTIDSNWFTREPGPLIKAADLIWFNPNGTTRNLVFRNNALRDATIDALALKKIIGGTIENNTIIDAATDTSRDQGCGMTVEGSSNLVIKGNHVERTGSQSMGGINLFGSSHDIVISDNTLINVEWGITLGGYTSNTTAVHNTIIDPFVNGIRVSYSTNIQLANNDIQQVNFYRNLTSVYIMKSNNITLLSNSITNFLTGVMIQYSREVSLRLNIVDSKADLYIAGRHGVFVYSSSSVLIEGNNITRSFEYGISVSTSPATQILENLISESQKSGIRLNRSNSSTVQNNTLKNNGNSGSSTSCNGIDIVDSFKVVFEWNKAYDDQSVKTQRYGLAESGISDYNFVIENDFRYNAVKAMLIRGTHTLVQGNQV